MLHKIETGNLDNTHKTLVKTLLDYSQEKGYNLHELKERRHDNHDGRS